MYQEQILPINGVRLWTAIQGIGQPMVLCYGGSGGYDYLIWNRREYANSR